MDERHVVLVLVGIALALRVRWDARATAQAHAAGLLPLGSHDVLLGFPRLGARLGWPLAAAAVLLVGLGLYLMGRSDSWVGVPVAAAGLALAAFALGGFLVASRIPARGEGPVDPIFALPVAQEVQPRVARRYLRMTGALLLVQAVIIALTGLGFALWGQSVADVVTAEAGAVALGLLGLLALRRSRDAATAPPRR